MKLKTVASSIPLAELFRGLSPADCQSIWSSSNEEVFSSGRQIFRQGEPQQKIFLLMEGLAKVSQLAPKGDEAILWLTVPGHVIGSFACSGDLKHSSTAVAVQSCRVVMWRVPAFKAILDRFPVLHLNVRHIVAGQIAELWSRISELSTAPTEVRLARTLIRMIDLVGRRVSANFEVNLPQEFLAFMIGTNVCYVNHLLSVLEGRGLVARRRRLIVIRDLAGLKNLCVKIHRRNHLKGDSVLISSGVETSELSLNEHRALGSCAQGDRLGSELCEDTGPAWPDS